MDFQSWVLLIIWLVPCVLCIFYLIFTINTVGVRCLTSVLFVLVGFICAFVPLISLIELGYLLFNIEMEDDLNIRYSKLCSNINDKCKCVISATNKLFGYKER